MFAFFRYPSIDPVIFRVGPVAVRWYGLAYTAGFVLAYVMLRRMIASGRLHLRKPQLDDLITWLVLGVLVGGRAGWWLAYHRSAGPEPWYEPLAVWHGGMSFHGGLAGVVLALVVWSSRSGASALNIADALAGVTPIGLMLGRLANYINAELVGRPTTLPWGVVFPGESFARHPSQLYEALLEGPILFALLGWLAKRQRTRGQTAVAFIILYGIFRFLVEFTRQPDEQLGFIAWGWLTMGQLLSLLLSGIGIALWILLGRRSGNGAGQPIV